MKLLRNSEINIDKWNKLLLTSKYSSPFQTWAFYNLYNSLENKKAEVFAIETEDVLKTLCVITIEHETGIKSYFSKRAIIYGGPVTLDTCEREFHYLLHNISILLLHEVIYIEVRNYTLNEELDSIYHDTGWKRIQYLNIRIALTGKSLEMLQSSMKYNRRREIRQSLKEGATYCEATTESEVHHLYSILKETYKTRVKLPLPDISFFLGLFRSEIGKVFIAKHNDKVIGGSFCLYLENNSVYTMYYCGVRDYSKKIFPTHLSILAAIEFGLRIKLTYLDFMGAGVQGKNYGVRNYKQEFGGKLDNAYRYRKINNKVLYLLGEIGIKILKFI